MSDSEYARAVARLTQWQMVLQTRWLGVRPDADPQGIAVRDVFEKLLLLRVEVSAITALLVQHGVCTEEEMTTQIVHEIAYLERALEKQFPGFKATDADDGIGLSPEAIETMKAWP